VAHLELALLDQRIAPRRELEQAQQIADRGARAADRLGGLLMRDAELGDQALERAGLLERIQVSRWMFSISAIAMAASSARGGSTAGIVLQARDLRGAPAAFAGDDLVALGAPALRVPADGAHDDGLDHALGPDRNRRAPAALSGRMSTRGWYLPRCSRSSGRCASSSPLPRGAAAALAAALGGAPEVAGGATGTGAAGVAARAREAPSRSASPRPRWLLLAHDSAPAGVAACASSSRRIISPASAR
jgi:hypothetical protein